MPDPYLPPSASIDAAPSGALKCPKCGNELYTKLGFTWWGGALGPRLLNAVRCNRCSATFSGRTGASLTGAIVIYQVVGFAIAAAIAGAYFAFKN
ncbi:MAG TPA: hypothetical protein VKQ32_04495 [Polyangia bacterium]|nr:hypothetical protein [Polyangia bacterium]